jgi:hypothetical protein
VTCSNCGNVLAQDVRFCPNCGTQLGHPQPAAYGFAPVAAPYLRVGRNLQALGVLWLVYAGLRALTALFGVVLLHGWLGSHFGHSSFDLGWTLFGRMGMPGLWPVAVVSILFSLGCNLLTGYALLTRQPWGRLLAIIFAIFALIHFPLGTALGIYTLWVLAPGISGSEYASLAYAQRGR